MGCFGLCYVILHAWWSRTHYRRCCAFGRPRSGPNRQFRGWVHGVRLTNHKLFEGFRLIAGSEVVMTRGVGTSIRWRHRNLRRIFQLPGLHCVSLKDVMRRWGWYNDISFRWRRISHDTEDPQVWKMRMFIPYIIRDMYTGEVIKGYDCAYNTHVWSRLDRGVVG